MSFFDRIRKGKLFFGKKEATIVVTFFFRGTKYILEELDLEFGQETDDKNKPGSEVKGGIITLTISQSLESDLTAWMMNSFEKRDGEFRFFVNEGKLSEGSLLDIQFKDAYCISYQKTFNPVGAGVLTTLILSARRIQIGEEVFENKWKN